MPLPMGMVAATGAPAVVLSLTGASYSQAVIPIGVKVRNGGRSSRAIRQSQPGHCWLKFITNASALLWVAAQKPALGSQPAYDWRRPSGN